MTETHPLDPHPHDTPPHDTQHDGLHTLGRWTGDRARATPERIAIDDRGVELSYRELHA